jgi:Dockerin type I domain/Right handed beta helix region/Immunoglobulin I-set domain
MSRKYARFRSSRSFRDRVAARARAGRRFRPCSLEASLEPRCLLATVTVSTTKDIVDGNTTSIPNLISHPGKDDAISLREAVIAADNTPGNNEIDIPAGAYTLTNTWGPQPPPPPPPAPPPAPTIYPAELDVFGASAGQTLTIQGAGSGTASITDKFGKDFSFNPIELPTGAFNQNIVLSGLTLTGVNSEMPNPLFNDSANEGGAFNFFDAQLTMTDVTVTNSSTYDGNGGGIAVYGQLTMTDVTVASCTSSEEGNGAGGDGGGIAITGPLNMNDVTVTNSGTTNGDGGGVAILGSYNVTITNSTFSRNNAFSTDTTPAAGGGIFIAPSSNFGRMVAISNSVINNNVTESYPNSTPAGTPGNGGGLYDGAEPESTLELHNVTVASNAAGGFGGSLTPPPGNLDGGGVYAAADNLTIDQGSSITDNITTNQGGGLFTSALTTTITSATIADNGLFATDGSLEPENIFVDSGSLMMRNSVDAALTTFNSPGTFIDLNANNNPTVDAANNFFGPYSAIDPPDPTLFGAGVIYQPFLVANVAASSTDLLPGETATVTLSITQNSDGLGGFSIPDNSQVVFGAINGTMNPRTTNTVAGVATSTFTPDPNFVGQATAAASLLVPPEQVGDTVFFDVAVGQAPVVTTQPVSQVVAAGQSVTLTAAASGFPAPTVQWQVSADNGVTYTNISGATATSYTFTATAATNGEFFQAVFTNSVGSTTSAAALITLAQATVTGVSVGWGSFGDSGPLVTQADGVRLLPVGRNTDLPWLDVQELSITFSAVASLTPADITVNGINVVDYGPVTVVGGPTTYGVLLARPIAGPDRVTVTISSTAIPTYTRRLDVLPGDVNDDGVVNSQDAIIVRNEIYPGLGTVTVPLTFLDIDGDGLIDFHDLNIVRQRNGKRLP